MRVVGQRGMCTLKILELLEEIKTDEGKKNLQRAGLFLRYL